MIPLTWSQSSGFQFNSLDKEDGLAGNNTRCFLKDSKGFIWIGTAEGLSRYDGYTFKNYTHNLSDSSSLRDNNINAIAEAPDGRFWITAGDYFEIFDPRTDRFDHSQTLFDEQLQIPLVSRTAFATDDAGNIWIGNTSIGLFRYHQQRKIVEKISTATPGHVHPTDTITAIKADTDGNIWVCDYRGQVLCFSPNGVIVKQVQIPQLPNNFPQLFIDHQNTIWIYDMNSNYGLLRYLPSTGGLSMVSHESTKGRLQSNIVTSVIDVNDENIWVGTDHGGIQVINKNTLHISHIKSHPHRKRSLCSNSVTNIYLDREGFIWIGSFKNGFSYYHPALFNFNLYQINLDHSSCDALNDVDNFAEDASGNLWIGTNGSGLVYYNRKNDTFTQYKHDPNNVNSLSNDIVIGMHMDRRGRLWAGTYMGGLVCYDQGRFTRFLNNPDKPLSLSDNRVWDICEDRDGMLWVSTLQGGITIIDPHKNAVVKVIKGLDSPLRSYVVFDINKGRLGELWIATVDGLRMYNPDKDAWQYYDQQSSIKLSHNTVRTSIEDHSGLIWIATADGLNLLDRATGNITVLRTDDGLPSNNILTLLEDNQGRIWMSTTHGISMAERKNINNIDHVHFTNFDDKDGLQGKVFNEKSAFKTRQGEMIFGGSQGFNIFDPDKVALQNLHANTEITDFQVFNQSITPAIAIDGHIFSDQTIAYTSVVELEHQFNLFSIEFASLNFFFPERRKYQYLLEGFQNDWLTTESSNRRITYTNLNPGLYTFKVKSTNTDGSWNDTYSSLQIKILPPWWDTLLFKILAVSAVLALMIVAYYARFYSIQHQKRKLEQQVTERTRQLNDLNRELTIQQAEISLQNRELTDHRTHLEEMVEKRTAELEKALLKAESADRLKSAFLANMSHEIRTPMNAIFGFSALLRDSEITPEENNRFIDIIQSSCDTLLVIINDILDISKIEANQLEINKRKSNIHDIFREMENYYALQTANEVKIICDINHHATNHEINTDPIRLHQIIVNLINNAIKFTHQGEIHYGYIDQGDILRFYVSDTGIGIDPKNFNDIFKEFNKLEPTNTKFYKGAGLGLSIAKKLTELLGGHIWLESTPGVGSTFYFTLPNA
ncbi:MAG: hypothetical protein JXR39_01725 [Marinilabiliaceae bacterium]|nr:hypothetical protein [Marinilabiliaceae bacterium]